MRRLDVPKRIGLALLAMLVVGAAQAQGKHMPSRTEDVPDTESGRPAASAERPTFKGRLLIYGPPSLPVTPLPEHVAPAQATPAPAAAPAPAATIAEPAPVVTPTKPVEAPVAVPIPAPVPPAPVAAPTPAPEPRPAPVVTAPPPQPAAAAPVAPSVIASPAPAPASPPVAAPAPASVVAAPEPPREPIVRPEAIAPAPAAAKPAAPRQDVALAVPSSAATPDAPVPIDMKVIESIFTCLAPGLPQDWRRAWVEITDQGGGKEKVSKFRYTNLRNDDDGEPLVPCNAQELTKRIIGLNEKLAPDRRGWNRALLVIESDGEYELSYEYPK